MTDLADTFAVFTANAVGSSGLKLWKANLAETGPAQPIVGPAAAGTTISTPVISPDGRWIEYGIVLIQPGYTYQRTLSVNLIPSDGSAGPRALPIIPNDSTLVGVGKFTPDSQTLLYLSDQSSGQYIWDVYAIAVNGQTPPRRITPAACVLSDYCWGPVTRDSQYMYLNLLNPAGVYRVPLSAPTPSWSRVSDPVAIRSLTLSADEQRLLGEAPDGSGHWNILSIDAAGIEPPVFMMNNFPTDSQGVGENEIACGGSCIVMTIDGRSSGSGVAVYQAPIDGSAPARLLFSVPPETQGLAAGQIQDSIRRMDVSPDGSRVVVSVVSNDLPELDLYAFPVDGSAPATRIANWSGFYTQDAWTPLYGGTHVVIVDVPAYGLGPRNVVRLSATVADGPRLLLSDATAFGLGYYLWTPDGRRILLWGDDGSYYLIDALADLLTQIYLPSLRR